MTSKEIRMVTQECLESVNEAEDKYGSLLALLVLSVSELAAQVAEIKESVTSPKEGWN